MRETKLLITCLALTMIAGCEKPNYHQKMYDMTQVPIVDMHTHLRGKKDFAQTVVKTMDGWGGTISITLNHNDTSLHQYIEIA